MSAQLALEETSLPSCSQEPTGEEKNSLTAPLYPEVNGTLEKAMPVSVTSESSESSESTTYEPSYKSCIDSKYERLTRQWGFDNKKTKEENIDIIQQKVTALEDRLNEQRFPRDEEEIELEGAKKLVEILPNIITSLMPIKMGNNPQQADWSFGDISSTLPHKTQISKPVTPMSNFDLEMLWQETIKRFGLSKERPENNERRAKCIWDIDQFRLDYYLRQHDELMIEAYRNELDILKEIGDKLLHIETHLLKERSSVFQEEHQFKAKILPFENNTEFYQCAETWGIKRNDSSQKIEGILTTAERTTRERFSEYFLLTLHERENYEKFRQDLVEIDKLQWYMKEVSLQPSFQSEITMNTNQKKTILETLVTPLLEGHEKKSS